MPRLTAYALDRANEWIVRWRLGGRLPEHVGEPVAEHLRVLGDHVHPDPDTLGELCPSRCGRGRGRWRAESPWPAAQGRNAVWHADTVAPRSTGSGRLAGARPKAGGTAPPALILLHGWLIDRPQLVVYRHWAHRVAAHGIEVWMPLLPYHMERAEPGEVSGQRCLSPDLSTSLDAVRQAVAEVRLLARWLRRRGAPAVGVWGMSLGGWVAGLAATLDADWDAVALWAPVASPAEVLFESRLVELLREAIVDGGLLEDDFAAPEMAWMTPAERDIRVRRSRVLVVAGIYDRVISPRSIARIAQRWNVDIRWVPHGHISLMAARVPLRDTALFLRHTLAADAGSG